MRHASSPRSRARYLAAIALPALMLALSMPRALAAEDSPVQELSLEQALASLKSKVAAQRKVAAEDIQVVEAEARTWPDASLGCPGRRRLMGPSPVPGYRFVLQLGEKRLTYHADTRGAFLRCDAPTKPLDPIAR